MGKIFLSVFSWLVTIEFVTMICFGASFLTLGYFVHSKKGFARVPLSIDFRAGDKIIINGAVIENLGSNSRLSIHNEAAILRGKEVLSAEDSNTPASRVYFSLQCAYIFPQNEAEYVKSFESFLRDYVAACPSSKSIAEDISSHVKDGELYRGLKSAQKLIEHEGNLLAALGADVEEAMKTAALSQTDSENLAG